MSMENKNMTNNPGSEYIGSTFIEFITLSVKYRWFLFWFVFLITAGATAYALLAPKWYRSTASVLTAEQSDLMTTLSGLSSLAKGFSASKGLAALTGGNQESDKYIAILKSATLTDEVIKKFDLKKEYDLENEYSEKVVKEWQSNLELEVQDEGNLTITVYDKDPNKAAAIANFMVERLNEINTTLSVTNAKANRIFVEKRYMRNIEDINELEESMKKFQQKYGVIAVPEQIEATVKSMADIYSDLYKKEIEYNVLLEKYGKNHPFVETSRIEMTELQKKIDMLNNGTDKSQHDVKLLIPFKEAPELGNEYLKIYRNLEIQYKILEFVQPLYEQAKVEEARNTPSVLVLDKAGPADRKAKPKGTIFASVSFVISLLLALFIIFFREMLIKMKSRDPEGYLFLQQSIRRDLSRIGFKK